MMTPITDPRAVAPAGHGPAAQNAFAQVYDDLHRLARSRLRQHRPMTLLDTTALVHESYLKVAGCDGLPLQDRHHFFAYVARAMRSVIVDAARARMAERRGGAEQAITLDTALGERLTADDPEVLRVHEALEVLAEADPRLAQIVELRWFGGFSEAEVAQVLELSERTVRRDWVRARLLLEQALQ